MEAADPLNYITKSEARTLTKEIAHVLRNQFRIGQHGPGRDAVLTVSYGGPFLPVFFYGVLAAGGIFSGASTAYQTAELVRQIRDAETTVLVCSEECRQRTMEAAKICGVPLDRVLVIDSAVAKQWKLISMESGEDVLSASKGKQLDWPRFTTQQELDNITTCLLYSSGTTGKTSLVSFRTR